MKAEYFYNRLLKYSEEVRTTGKRYSTYGNDGANVKIHRKNDNSKYYLVHTSGCVMEYDVNKADYTNLGYSAIDKTLADIDDFEVYSTLSILKSGYLVFRTNSEKEIKKIISLLHKEINDNHKDKNILYPGEYIIESNARFKKPYNDGFVYCTPDGVSVRLSTVKKLCVENTNRRYYDTPSIPFIKSMKNEVAIHVSFIDDTYGKKPKDAYKNCERALAHIMTTLRKHDINFRYVGCKMNGPVYY